MAAQVLALAPAAVLLGAYVNLQAGGGSEANFTSVETAIGRTLALDYQYESFNFTDLSREAWDISQHRTPLIAWDSNFPAAAGCATAADIVAGKYDSQLASQAAAIQALGKTVMISFVPEMTDAKPTMDCFYGAGWEASADTMIAAGHAFAMAQNYVWTAFHKANVTNVRWIFAPEGLAFSTMVNNAPLWTYFFPGDGFLDWIGTDHHYGGAAPYDLATDSVFQAFYRDAGAHNLPLMLTQTAALAGDAQTELITTAHGELPTQFPALRGFVYNDGGKQDTGGADGGFVLTGTGLTAFAAMGQDPYFTATAQ